MRLAIRTLDQVSGQRLDPAGIDSRSGTEITARGLNHLAGDNPFRSGFERGRARPEPGLQTAGDRVVVMVGPQRNAGKEAGEQRTVDRLLIVAPRRMRETGLRGD